MRKSIILIAIAVIGSLLAHFLLEDRGMAMIQWRGVEYRTSVPGFIMVLALGYLLLRLFIRMFRAPRKFGQAVSAQRQNRARRKLNRGLIEMAEGNWKRGEAMLAQGARSGDMPLLNYLNAARAAQLQGEHERRDNWLMLAYEQDADASTAVLLTQADLQISHQQYEEALATLRKVEEMQPGHTHAQVMLATIYERLEDWGSLYTLTPKLKKIKKSPAQNEITRLIGVAGRHRMNAAGIAGDTSLINKTWQGFAMKTRKEPAMVSAYAEALQNAGASDQAESIVKKTLAANWNEELAMLYGRVEGSAPKKQLTTAEGWLKTRGDNPGLLITVARLSMRNELWGKARSYLESAIAIQPRADAYQIYGELLTQLGETENAATAFRQGLALMTGGVSLTPALTGPDAEAAASSGTSGEDSSSPDS